MTSPRPVIRALALVVTLALLTTTAAAAGRTIGQIIDDATITTKVKAAFIKDKVVKATEVNVYPA